MKVIVRCSFDIEIEAPDDSDPALLKWRIEENSCPGTGIVGAAIEAQMAWADKVGVCAFCPSGQNMVLEMNGVKYEN